MVGLFNRILRANIGPGNFLDECRFDTDQPIIQNGDALFPVILVLSSVCVSVFLLGKTVHSDKITIRQKLRMKKIELEIVSLAHSVSQSSNYTIVLGETEGSRRLPVVIGGFEAQAIAVAMERMTPNRPLTHDLFKNTLDVYDIEVREVIINQLLDGIFYAQLVCVLNGDIIEIDSRTSDALAMAVRFKCPIYTYASILDQAGVTLETPDQSKKRQKQRRPTRKQPATLSSRSLEELEKMLDKVLNNEDYEQAAKIRDEINRRQEN